MRSGGILLGARTFWQGLDIPGPALQAVVIEKLPFEVPTELRKRREARIKQAGHDAFERYTLGKMLLNLKQMTGRLIRTEEDRGIVVIVEGRTRPPLLQEAGPGAAGGLPRGDRDARRSARGCSPRSGSTAARRTPPRAGANVAGARTDARGRA